MRRSHPVGFLAGLVCGAGALFAFRWRLRLLRRQKPGATPDPAEELRRKLEETRAEPPLSEPVASEPEPAPEPVTEPEPEPEPEPEEPEPALDDRRREVHDRGRAAIERMRGEPPPDETH